MFQWGVFSDKSIMSIIRSTARVNLWEGSVRSAKTIASICRWIEYVKNEAPEGLLVMIGRTQGTIQRNVIDVITDMLGTNDAYFLRGSDEFYLLGRKIVVLGANDERAKEKIQGSTIVGAYGDEVALWPESFYSMLLSRLSVKGAKFFGTTNPDSPYHWLKMNFIDRAHELDMLVFHFTLDDNPTLDPAYVENLKKEYTGLWYKRYILGLWVRADGTIYDMWDEAKHSGDVSAILRARGRTQFQRYFTATDYGTNNPCTFGLYGYDGGAPPVYLVKEYYYDSKKAGRQKTDSEYGADFVNFIQGIRPIVANYVDPSAASFMAELRKRGVPTTPAKNEVLDGIRFVGSMLHNGLYLVDKRCSMTIKEYAGYVWDEKAQKRGEDAPLKTNDHAMDRDRYALFSHFHRLNAKLLGFNYR